MPEEPQVSQASADAKLGASQGSSPSPASPAPEAPFNKDTFIAEYTKREKKAIADATTPLQREIKRLQSVASLKDLPEDQREVLADRGSFNTDAAQMVKDRFSLPDDLEEDILKQGSYSAMVKYGERMAKILGTATKGEAKSIAEDLASKPNNISEIVKTAAMEKVMQSDSSARVQSRYEAATKDTIDKLWLAAEAAGGENPYADQYRKFLRTGTL